MWAGLWHTLWGWWRSKLVTVRLQLSCTPQHFLDSEGRKYQHENSIFQIIKLWYILKPIQTLQYWRNMWFAFQYLQCIVNVVNFSWGKFRDQYTNAEINHTWSFPCFFGISDFCFSCKNLCLTNGITGLELHYSRSIFHYQDSNLKPIPWHSLSCQHPWRSDP